MWSRLIPSLGSTVTLCVALYNHRHVVKEAAAGTISTLNVAAQYTGAVAVIPAGYFLGKAFYESSCKTKLEDYLFEKCGYRMAEAMNTAEKINDVVSGSMVFGAFIPISYLIYQDFV